MGGVWHPTWVVGPRTSVPLAGARMMSLKSACTRTLLPPPQIPQRPLCLSCGLLAASADSMTIQGYQVATALPIDWKRSGPVRGVGSACRCVGVENVHVTGLTTEPEEDAIIAHS